MEADFWHRRWEGNQIGFHEGRVNRMLAAHHTALPIEAGARIFLPLCGKTRDIAWLREQGYRVAGAELSAIAVAQLFEEMSLMPVVAAKGALIRHSIAGVDVFQGDIFDLDAATLGPVDAIYDRAALVALPDGMRARYTRHMIEITNSAPQLLVTFEYDQSAMDGPPFSIPDAWVHDLYGGDYRIALLDDQEVPGKLKGICPAREKAWLLKPASTAGG